MNKTIILGLDGATFDVLDKLIDKKKIPTIEFLINNGIKAKLNSTIPPVTSPAWISFSTGLNPGRFGAFGWTNFDTDTYKPYICFPKTQNVKRYWDILGEYGLSPITLFMPIHYPPPKTKGIFISGYPGAASEKGIVNSVELEEELRRKIGDFKIFLEDIHNEKKLYDSACKILDFKIKTAEYLIKNKAWDVFFMHFIATDALQHVYWKHFDQTHINYTGDKKYIELFESYWEKLDKSIKKIIELEPDANILLMSDHGFGKVEQWFYPNSWLQQNNFLFVKINFIKKILKKIGVNSSLIKDVLKVLKLDKISSIVSKDNIKLIKKVLPEKMHNRLYEGDVIWEKTKAFANSESYNTGLIYINKDWVFKKGCVSKTEYPLVLQDLIDKLNELRNPITGQKVKVEVYKGQEIYNGGKKDLAPDLVFNLDDQTIGMTGDINKKELIVPLEEFDAKRSGNHRQNGIFIVSGPNVIKNSDLKKLDLIDIIPTLLDSYGVTEGKFDGKIVNIFKDKDDKRVKKEDGKVREIKELDSEENQKVLGHLESLGYL